MSLPRFSVIALSASLLIAGGIAGCSSNPSKASLKDTGPQRSEQAYYENAQKSLKRGQYTEANKSLEALDTYYPTGQYTEQAQLDLMYSRFMQSDYPGTITVAERFMRIYPNNPQIDYVYYIRGVANMEQNYDGLLRYTNLNQSHRDSNYLRVAYGNFREFVQRYPSSRYAVDAAQRMQYINQELAESEMNIARFNLKRKAWLAAVQRARWVLEYYPQTPQTPEALATMVYGYQKLGDYSTANQYLDVIRQNYPQLVKGDSVNLDAARGKASLLNRATLGILGRDANIFIPKEGQAVDAISPAVAPQVEANPVVAATAIGTAPQIQQTQPVEQQPEVFDESKSTSKIGTFLRMHGLPGFGLGIPKQDDAQSGSGE